MDSLMPLFFRTMIALTLGTLGIAGLGAWFGAGHSETPAPIARIDTAQNSP